MTISLWSGWFVSSKFRLSKWCSFGGRIIPHTWSWKTSKWPHDLWKNLSTIKHIVMLAYLADPAVPILHVIMPPEYTVRILKN
jgi:hypothetical protein